ncbi:MAG: SDR family oxidoreductase [Nocardioides sp.]|uniref:SDR family oxidoreductase n=1 Tax=Nocardioides sp. TaxID=35761 RepID=UPI0039E55E87
MKTHVLTGAGSGIGQVLAERLRDRGDRLVLLARDQDRVDQLRPDFPEAEFVVADLATPESLTDLGARITDPIDSLLHVAGVLDLGPVAEQDLASWRHQLDVNLTAPAVLTTALLPQLRRARGTVVFVNSSAGLTAHANWSAYAASKFGLRALAEALRAEEAEHGIRVTSVFPGRTATPMQARVHEQEGRAYDPAAFVAPDTVAEAILHVLDLPDNATIGDLSIRPR